MALVLNDENIQKLLECRKVFDEHIVKPIDVQKHNMANIEYEMAVIGGFSNLMAFEFFNEAMNILEYDRCHRIRVARDVNITDPVFEDFCIGGSGCKKRGIPSCVFDPSRVACFNREWSVLNFLPYSKSEMTIEFTELAKNVNADVPTLFIPHPTFCIGSHAVSPETDMPPDCLGVSVQIHVPRFNVFWGMDRMFNFAKLANIARESIRYGE